MICRLEDGYTNEELARAIAKCSVPALNGPYKFYAEIDDRICYSVSKQFGTYDNPEVEVYMECPIGGRICHITGYDTNYGYNSAF